MKKTMRAMAIPLNPKSNQRNVLYLTQGLAPTLQTAMGTGGGQVPLVLASQKSTSMPVKSITNTLTTIGVLALAVDNELDIYSLVGWLIITVQSVLVLIYVNNKK